MARKIKVLQEGYAALAKVIRQELDDLEFFVKRRTAEGYWRVGRYIHRHLLKNKERAGYGEELLERLARDVDRDITSLSRALRFYRTYPILAPGQELTWGHYRTLITVKEKEQRKMLERQIIKKKWDTHQLQKYLSAKRELAASDNGDQAAARLAFTRGRLNAYAIVAANKSFVERSPLALDLGFRQQYLIPKTAARFKEGDHAELVFERGALSGAGRIDISKEEIFTYQARMDKVVDGDTFLVSFDFHLDVSISQKLRLRGIDCLEIDTREGKKAKRFVESRLKECEFIIVKTHKDRSDKFDRYLADVFFLEGATDPLKVAKEGLYLNQELLDHRLAVLWK